MKTLYRLSVVVFLICLFTATSSSQYQWYPSTTDDNWTNGNNWYNYHTGTYGVVPPPDSTVQIFNGPPWPDVNANASCTWLGIASSAGLNFNTSGATLTVSGDVNVNGGGTISFGSDGTLVIGGTLQVNDTGTLTASQGTVKFNSSSGGQRISGSAGNTPTFNDLIIDNAGGMLLETPITVNGTLILGSHNFDAGSHTLTIGSGGSVSRTSGYVIGNLAKVYSTTGSKTFEVGTANGYSPVAVNATAGTGTFTVKATGTKHPNASGTDVLQRYWTLTSSGITTATLTFYYLATDVPSGSNEALYQLARYSSGSWTYFSNVSTSTHSVTQSGVNSFSDWTCGIATALPIQMASFAANVVRDNQVEVTWKTVSETNNYGFEIYRKRGETGEWTRIGFVQGHGTTLAPQSYTYVDPGLSFGKYTYRIKQVDLNGESETFPEMSVTVGVSPDEFVLAQNYPNPFNPSTVIEFVVPQSGFATMKVYNVLGQEVATVFEGNAQAGKINTARFNASSLPSGAYFYTLRSTGRVETKRMLLMK
jgi:hypothetical protein